MQTRQDDEHRPYLTEVIKSPEDILAPLFAQLLHLRNNDNCSVVDICARSFDMLNSLVPYAPQAHYIGIDRKQAPISHYIHGGMDDFPQTPGIQYFHIDDPTAASYYGIAVQGDIFDKIPLIHQLAESSNLKVICRPPTDNTMSSFPGSLPDAERLINALFAIPPHQTDKVPRFFTPEWYFLCACAALMGDTGRAIIQIPARLLNLAKCMTDRQRIISLHIIEMVILLPSSLSHGPTHATDALVVLKRNSDTITFLDGRSFGTSGKQETATRLQPLVTRQQAAERAVASIRNELSFLNRTDLPLPPWAIRTVPEQLREDSWTLNPFLYAEKSSPQSTYALIQDLFAVTRGTPRKTLTSMQNEVDSCPGDNHLAYYRCLSMKPFIDGSHVSIDSIPESTEDVYRLPVQASSNHPSIKTIDDTLPHLLIARNGAPFKVALLGPRQQENVKIPWPKQTLVLADSVLCLTPIHNSPCLPEYLLAFLSSDEGQELLAKTAHGTHLQQLSVGDIKHTRIPVPPLEIQHVIAEQFHNKQIAYEHALAEVERTRESKRSLDLSPTVTGIEPVPVSDSIQL